MPNRFLTPEEVGKKMFDAMKEFAGNDVKKQRQFIYFTQCTFGGFPFDEKEFKQYVETGEINEPNHP